jgi:hypothetical protein
MAWTILLMGVKLQVIVPGDDTTTQLESVNKGVLTFAGSIIEIVKGLLLLAVWGFNILPIV